MTTARAKTAFRGKTAPRAEPARAETPVPMTPAPKAPAFKAPTLKTEAQESQAPGTPAPAAPAPLTLAPTQPAARPRLSDAALLLLGQAAARDDRLLLPPPPALRARGSALQKVLQALLKAGLVTEVPVTTEAQSWRSGDDGTRIGLVIAAEGFRAIGLPVPAPAAPLLAPTVLAPAAQVPAPTAPVAMAPMGLAAAAAGQGAPPAAEAAGRTTKQAILIALLSVEAGASVPALAETLAWQNHTVRAALTGLRQKGHELARSKDADGTTVYRITGRLAVTEAAGATGAAAAIGA